MRGSLPRPGTSSRRRFSVKPAPEALEGRELLSLAASQLLGLSATNPSQAFETTSVKLDANGNTVVGGSFQGTIDLDPANSYPDNRDLLISNGLRDGFVAKFSPSGGILWSRTLGAGLDDRVAGVAIDGAGNVYASGFITGNVDFGSGHLIDTSGRADIFVWKIDGNDPTHTVYANHAVGPARLGNQALDIAVTPSGDAFVSGFIVRDSNPDTPDSTTFGTTVLTPTGPIQGVLTRLDTSGNFLWATTYDTGAANRNFFERITLDKDGNVLATGAIATPTNGGGDILINKYNGANGALGWSRTIGGPDYDAGADITTDPNTGDVYTIGRFIGPVDFNPGANTPGDTLNAPIGQTSFYVLKLSGTSGGFQWVRDLGARNNNTSGTTDDIGRPSIALDPLGHVVAAVAFQGSAVVVPGLIVRPGVIGTGGIIFSSQSGSIDTLLVRLNESNGTVIEARRAGGGGIDIPTGLASRPGYPVVLTGNFTNAGGATARFSTAGNVITPAANVPLGADSVFIARFSERFASQHSPTDFDGDGRGDLIVYDPMRSDIFIKTASAAANQRIFGPGALFSHPTKPLQEINPVAPQAVVGDFDGDGLADVAVFRPDTSQFYTLYSDLWNVQSPPANHNQVPTTLTSAQPFFFGPGGLFTGARFNPIPLAGDIDGDGRDDLIVYDPMSSTFFVLPSNPGSSAQAVPFGPPTPNSSTVPPVPISADVNGDGRDDLIVYYPDAGRFYVRLSGATLADNAGTEWFDFGPATAANRFRSTPIAGDFDGDGKADVGVYDPMESRIYLRNTSIYYNGTTQNNFLFGPAPGPATAAAPTLGVSDLNGDGRDDIVVYNPMTSVSYSIINTPNGGATATAFGPALNITRNRYAPAAPPAPAVAAINPYRNVAPAVARVTTNFIPPTQEATVTPLALTPTTARYRRASTPRLTTLG